MLQFPKVGITSCLGESEKVFLSIYRAKQPGPSQKFLPRAFKIPILLRPFAPNKWGGQGWYSPEGSLGTIGGRKTRASKRPIFGKPNVSAGMVLNNPLV